jgi:hypothetical protein
MFNWPAGRLVVVIDSDPVYPYAPMSLLPLGLVWPAWGDRYSIVTGYDEQLELSDVAALMHCEPAAK